MTDGNAGRWLPRRGHCRFVTTLMMSAALCLGALPKGLPVTPAAAQTARAHSFNIPRQPLSRALRALADQSGVQIAYRTSIASGTTAPAVSGTMTTEQALARLLAGTSLSYSFTGANTVTIGDHGAAVRADGSWVLDTIEVSAGSGASAGGADPAEAPYRTPGSSAYIGREQIERNRGTSVGDFLRGTPGVLNSDNRNSGALDVNIRGMQGQGRVPVIVDGAQQETTVYRGYAGIAGRTYIDPDLIGDVTIEKGPSSAADAAGAIGGVVRMNTLTADDILLPGRSVGMRLTGGFITNSSPPPAVGTKGGLYGAGTYPSGSVPDEFGGADGLDRPSFLEPTGWNGSVALGAATEHLELVAAYARRKNGNYHAGTNGGSVPEPAFVDLGNGRTRVEFEGLTRYRAGEEVLNTSQNNTSYLVKGAVKLDGGHRLELGFNKYHSDYGEMMPSMIIRGPGAYEGFLNEVDVESFTSRYSWAPADNDLIDVNVNAYYNNVVTRINSSLNFFDTIYPNRHYSEGDRWGVTVDNTSRLSTSYGDLSFNYGASFSHEKVGFPDDEEFDFFTDSIFREGWRREASGFGAVEWSPSDWLTLNASLRYTAFKTHDRNPNADYVPGSSTEWELTYGEPFERSGNGWSPIASVTIEPVDGIQLWGKYAAAIRSPSLFESTSGWSHNIPDQPISLAPERSNLWEVGVNVSRDDLLIDGDKVRFKASYFDNRVDDYITRIHDASIANIDHARLKGFELSASYDAGRFFGDVGWTHYTDTDYCVRPDQAEGAQASGLCYAGGVPNSYVINQVPPKDTLSLTLGGRALDRRLTFGGTVTYVGARPASGLGGAEDGSTGSLLAHVEWRPYTTFDLFASYEVSETLRIEAAIDNLTDVYYLDPLAMGLVPGPGRTFRANLTARF